MGGDAAGLIEEVSSDGCDVEAAGRGRCPKIADGAAGKTGLLSVDVAGVEAKGGVTVIDGMDAEVAGCLSAGLVGVAVGKREEPPAGAAPNWKV